jgi:REP element-mobilizing transposase RayT
MVMPPDPWTAFDTPLVVPNPGRVRYEKEKLSHPAVTLNQRQQDLVLQSVRETCKHRQWPLWAVQVRTNHAHVVLQSPQPPEKCLITLKAYATRWLRKNFLEKEWSQVWTRHGSTRYLWKIESVENAIDYAIRQQGDPLGVWENKERSETTLLAFQKSEPRT